MTKFFKNIYSEEQGVFLSMTKEIIFNVWF